MITNTRHVCTYLDAFLRVIPILVTKFQNVDSFKKKKKLNILDLSSDHVSRVVGLSVNALSVFQSNIDRHLIGDILPSKTIDQCPSTSNIINKNYRHFKKHKFYLQMRM